MEQYYIQDVEYKLLFTVESPESRTTRIDGLGHSVTSVTCVG